MRKCCIDNVLLTIWPCFKGRLLEFFHGLKLVHPNLTITVTMEISYISVQFLDFTISKRFSILQTDLLTMNIYFKDTNTFSYLHGSSYIA